MPDLRMRPGFIITASIVLLVLVVSLFGLTSLNLSFISPSGSVQTILLFVLSTIIFLSLVILGFILFRSILKLYLERRANQLGSKFKTKMVCGALGLSLLPVCFLFLFSYSLINRTLDKWFSRPLEAIGWEVNAIVDGLEQFARSRAEADARMLALDLETAGAASGNGRAGIEQRFRTIRQPEGMDYVAVLDAAGELLLERRFRSELPDLAAAFPDRQQLGAGEVSSALAEFGARSYVLAQAPLQIAGEEAGAVVVGVGIPAQISESAARLRQESILYEELSQERKTLRQTYISILFLLTLLILFIATWFALFLSRQVTVPIQALAEATREVSRGNLYYRIKTKAADELGILVQSFNEMTGQLAAGRAEVEKSRSHLEQMNTQLDQRRRLTEAILESIPTGVISVSQEGAVLGSNTAARRLFDCDLSAVGPLSNLFSPEDMRELDYLMKRAVRVGQASRQLELKLNGRAVQLAVTVAALAGEPPASAQNGTDTSWFVIVLEDLSDLLRAQKEAAWGEVAQRIAHEIKNPLTPIALSAERINLWLKRPSQSRENSPEFNQVIRESCALIDQEVENLRHLVDTFSQFAQFPKAHPAPADLNQIVESALGLFDGRLDGIRIRTELASPMPLVQVDANHFRRVFVNLIDNAAEAMEASPLRELVVATRTDSQREVVEVIVADTGPGVTLEEREKLFLPYFSTKDRGTGLGLAIVSRIVTEHGGIIRVEENQPTGARFIIELPILAA
ncbi:MAG: HAMP domain-containing protein [Acidobacteria bacterium]|nr:HAMP domain-containing protein [Acidobacteriota bacterium]